MNEFQVYSDFLFCERLSAGGRRRCHWERTNTHPGPDGAHLVSHCEALFGVRTAAAAFHQFVELTAARVTSDLGLHNKTSFTIKSGTFKLSARCGFSGFNALLDVIK